MFALLTLNYFGIETSLNLPRNIKILMSYTVLRWWNTSSYAIIYLYLSKLLLWIKVMAPDIRIQYRSYPGDYLIHLSCLNALLI